MKNLNSIIVSLMALFIILIFASSCEQEHILNSVENNKFQSEAEMKSLLQLLKEERLNQNEIDEVLQREYKDILSRNSNCQHCDNCVKYTIHCKGIPGYPVDMTRIEEKKSVVTQEIPCQGCVAIIDNGYIYTPINENGQPGTPIETGHVAYVSNYYYKQHHGYRIRLSEGGWNGGCNTRWVWQGNANICGFYKPGDNLDGCN